MKTWDEVIEIYQDFASMPDQLRSSIGKKYLNIIRLLQADSETANTDPEVAILTLYLTLPDYLKQSVHISWMIVPDIYEIYLTPKPNDAPDATRVKLSEVVPTVKAFLQQLRIKRDQT